MGDNNGAGDGVTGDVIAIGLAGEAVAVVEEVVGGVVFVAVVPAGGAVELSAAAFGAAAFSTALRSAAAFSAAAFSASFFSSAAAA